jgi:hypothetical protein
MARWLRPHGFRQVLFVEIVYLLANVVTFLIRFVIFHCILFADRPADARDKVIAPDVTVAGPRSLRPAEAPEAAALNVTAMASTAK